MVFSTKTLLESKNNSFVSENDNINCDKSLFIEMLDMISEEDNEFRKLYIRNNILTEGLAGEIGCDILKTAIKRINPKEIFTRILEKFISFLEDIWNKFRSSLLELSSKGRVINKYKNQLRSIDMDVDIHRGWFIFSKLDSSTGFISFKNELDKEYSNLIDYMNNFKNYSSYEDLYKKISDMQFELETTEEYYDIIRGNVLGLNNFIKKELFGTELFNYFRSGGFELESSVVPASEIRLACDRYFNYKNNIKSVLKDKSDIKDAANKIKKNILNIKFEDYVKETVPKDVTNIFISVIKDMSIRIQNMCKIFLQVFSAKLDAIKDEFNQSLIILFAACKELVREGIA